MSRMAFSHEWARKRLYDSFYKLFYEIEFSLHADSWDDHFWHVLFIKKCCFLGKANTGHFIKNDLHEPCFLWNAFYKHLRFGFGILEFGLDLGFFTSIFWCVYVNSPGFGPWSGWSTMFRWEGRRERRGRREDRQTGELLHIDFMKGGTDPEACGVYRMEAFQQAHFI